MTQVIKIKQGLDIKLKGQAEKAVECIEAKLFAIQPTDFVGVTPRLLVQEGDPVEVGTPLFIDKHDERIRFTSPVSGTVKEIRRGEKRLLKAVVIEADKQMLKQVQHDEKRHPELVPRTLNSQLSPDLIKEKLLETGLWPMMRPVEVSSPLPDPKNEARHDWRAVSAHSAPKISGVTSCGSVHVRPLS